MPDTTIAVQYRPMHPGDIDAVDEGQQRSGVGRVLVTRAVDAARARGIAKCHAMVFARNEEGRAFWERLGWSLRDDLVVYSRDLEAIAPDSSPDAAAGERA